MFTGIHPKQLALALVFSRWRRPCAFEDGYTIVLPSPMDMPFLLRYALEGLAHLNTENCRQILVVPDGCVDDRGDALQRVIDVFRRPPRRAGPAARIRLLPVQADEDRRGRRRRTG